jgi:hypothetical protein
MPPIKNGVIIIVKLDKLITKLINRQYVKEKTESTQTTNSR